MAKMPTTPELIVLGREIFEFMVYEPRPFAVSVKRIQGGSHAFVPSVYGLALHAVNSGHAMIELHEQGRYVLGLPLTRLAFECAIQAMWLVHTDEGLKGFYNEGHRQRENTFKKMAASPNQIFSEGAQARQPDDPMPESYTDAHARNFEQMCESLVGGHDAYILYRILSEYSHPSIRLIDEYLIEEPASSTGVRLVTSPGKSVDDEGHSMMWVTVVAMLWGARALDYLQQSHPHRSRLVQIAGELQAPETLLMTQTARVAHMKKQQAERRSAWKGPKPKRRGNNPE